MVYFDCEARLPNVYSDPGYDDDTFRGEYVLPGCTPNLESRTGLAYCRWVGNSGPGGDPTEKITHGGPTGESWWSCQIGDSNYAWPSDNQKISSRLGKKGFEWDRVGEIVDGT